MSQAIETDVILCPPSEGWEQVDPATWKIIQQLFPEQTRGQSFFMRFLERAAREQSQIPDVPTTSPYICIQSIAALGQELGFSNDTTQKYVQLYMALGLLRKIKFMDRLAFLLSVGPYQAPETLEANLDHLLAKSRPRLREMTSEVKARCKLYGLISQDFITALSHLNTFLATTKGNKRTLEQHLGQAQILISRLLITTLATGGIQANLPIREGRQDEEKKQALQESPHRLEADMPTTSSLSTCISQRDSYPEEKSAKSPQEYQVGRPDPEGPNMNLSKHVDQRDFHLFHQNRDSSQDHQSERFDPEGPNENLSNQASQGDSHLPGKNGESPLDRMLRRNLPTSMSREDSIQEEGNHESPHKHNVERLELSAFATNLPNQANQGDSIPKGRNHESPQPGQSGRLVSGIPGKNLPTSTSQGDSAQVSTSSTSPQTPQMGRLGASNLSTNLKQGDSDDVPNVNVITIINLINVNVKGVAGFCCQALDETSSKQGIYLKLFQQIDLDIQAIIAALIYTLVHKRDRSMQNPPAVFYNRCKDFHQATPPDSAVYTEAQDLVKRYGNLPYKQLIETLNTPKTQVSSKKEPTFVSKPAPAPLLPPLQLEKATKIEPARAAMSKGEADALMNLIHQDSRTSLFRTQRVRFGKDTARYAVLVDASLPKGPSHQTLVYSTLDWQTRLSTMGSWRDLFHPGEISPVRPRLQEI